MFDPDEKKAMFVSVRLVGLRSGGPEGAAHGKGYAGNDSGSRRAGQTFQCDASGLSVDVPDLLEGGDGAGFTPFECRSDRIQDASKGDSTLQKRFDRHLIGRIEDRP